jgi:hypothetical protein
VNEGCRLWLGNWVSGEGPSLQAAADDLVDRLSHLAHAFAVDGLEPHGTASPMRMLAALGRQVTSVDDQRELVIG